ncbi:MAG: HEAT repeat domain-containing protein [Cyanobacteria bacterium J06633_8]
MLAETKQEHSSEYAQITPKPTPQVSQPPIKKTPKPNQAKTWQKFKKQLQQQWQVVMGVVIIGGIVVVYFGIIRFQPLWLLLIPNKFQPQVLKIGKFAGFPVVLEIPIALLRFIKYRPRVLDAWVEQHIETFSEKFLDYETLQERKDCVSVPVKVDEQDIEELAPETLRETFQKNKRVRVLIWGEGGSGKTTLASQIAKWAIEKKDKSKRLNKHLMLPVLIEEELETLSGEDKNPLMEVIISELQECTDSEQTIVDELLVEQLLRQQRILLIVDGYSEMSKQTHQKINIDSRDFPGNALVITSRINEKIKAIDNKIETLRFDGEELVSFIKKYLKQLQKWDLFKEEQEEFLQECSQLVGIVGEKKTITVLLAKLYAERMINAKENSSVFAPSLDNIPDLIVNHLEKLNRQGERDTRNEYPAVKEDAKIIAWKCLEAEFKPQSVKREAVIQELNKEDEEAEACLKYFEKDLRLIQSIGYSNESIRFALDPLAEYLAGLNLVDICRDNEESWREFLQKARNQNNLEEIKGFLLAVRECCLAKDTEVKVPESVLEELTQLAGLDMEALQREQLNRRIKRLLNDLFVPEREDRLRAVKELDKIGTPGKHVVAALVRTLKDNDSEIRQNAAQVLIKLGNSSEELQQGLLAIVQNQNDNSTVRYHAAQALGNLGNSSQKVEQGLLAIVQNQNDNSTVRYHAAKALGNLGNSSPEVEQGLLAIVQNQNDDAWVRYIAAQALGNLGNSSQKVEQGLLAIVQNQNDHPCMRYIAAQALIELGNSLQEVKIGLQPLIFDPFVGDEAAELWKKLRNDS